MEEGQQGEVLRVDPVDPPGCLAGMQQTASAPRQTEDGGHRQLDPCLACLAGLPGHLVGREALPDLQQGLVIARFQPEIEDAQALLPQQDQLLRAFGGQAVGRGIGSDPGQTGEGRRQRIQDLRQPLEGIDQCVAIGQEYAFDLLPVALRDPGDLGQDLSGRAQVEAFSLVHAAESAAVLGAADRDLEDQAAGLAGGAEDRFDIMRHHGRTPRVIVTGTTGPMGQIQQS